MGVTTHSTRGEAVRGSLEGLDGEACPLRILCITPVVGMLCLKSDIIPKLWRCLSIQRGIKNYVHEISSSDSSYVMLPFLGNCQDLLCLFILFVFILHSIGRCCMCFIDILEFRLSMGKYS